MSFLLYMCVNIYICSSYLDTVTILKSSWSMQKSKKWYYYPHVINGKLVQEALVQGCVTARNTRPILLNPILKQYAHN